MDNFKLNENPKQITYNDHIEIHKSVINKYSNELNETKVNNLINDMNINEDNLKEFNPLNNENLIDKQNELSEENYFKIPLRQRIKKNRIFLLEMKI